MTRRFFHSVDSFSSGEVTPKLYGRVDLSQYNNGVKTLENFTILPHGGITRRMGFEHISEVKTSSDKCRLIPFIFSETVAYVLELGNLYMRFYTNRGRLESGGTPVEIATPWDDDEIFDLQFAQSADAMFITHPDFAVRVLERTSATSFTLGTANFVDGPYYSDIHETYSGAGSGTTLSSTAVAGNDTITASANLFVSTDVGRLIRMREATSDAWGYAEITSYTSATSVDVTWKVATDTILTSSANWQLGAFSDTTGYPGAITFHEQRLVLASTADLPQTLFFSVSGDITNFAPDDATASATITDQSGIVVTLAASKVNVIQWLNSQNRLFVGTSGQVYAASASSLNEAITPSNISVKPSVATGAAFKRPVSSQNVTLFLHYFRKKLYELSFFFEEDSYRTVDLFLLSDHLTSDSRITELADQDEPDGILWALRDDGVLLGLTYLRQQKVVGWHKHIVGGSFGAGDAVVESITSIPGAAQDELWIVVKRTIDGSTVRYIEVIADIFTRETDKEDAIFLDSTLGLDDTKSIVSITQPSTDIRVEVTGHGWSTGDQVYIKDNTSTFDSGADPEDLNRIWTITKIDNNNIELDDSDGMTLDTATTVGTIAKLVTSVSGLDHLEGESVTPFVDGAVQPNATVTSGSITLSTPGARVLVGLPYTSKVETLNLDSKSSLGTPQTSLQRVVESRIRFDRSLGGKIGTSASDTVPILFRSSSTPFNESPALFSGDKKITFPGNWERGSTIYIENDQPLPMTITMLINKVLIGEQ